MNFKPTLNYYENLFPQVLASTIVRAWGKLKKKKPGVFARVLGRYCLTMLEQRVWE